MNVFVLVMIHTDGVPKFGLNHGSLCLIVIPELNIHFLRHGMNHEIFYNLKRIKTCI